MRPENWKPHHIRIASRYFDPLLNAADVQLYTLTSGDLVLVCKDFPLDDMDDTINKVCHLFKMDPLTRNGIDN